MFENLYLLLGTPTASGGSSGGAAASLIPFALIFLVMYLLIIRPQSRKQKALKSMLANISKGDKVITAGGIHGVVAAVNAKTVAVRVDDNLKIEFTKESIATVVADKPAEIKKEKVSEVKSETKSET